MKQLQLFNLPDKYNYINEFVPRFPSNLMDKLASVAAMGWREELSRRNFELRYKQLGG